MHVLMQGSASYHSNFIVKLDERIPFELVETNTGRHCCLDGFGEQCDLWEEGKASIDTLLQFCVLLLPLPVCVQLSEFTPFGVGITNYFKFLKWLSWVFAVAGIISLPELILNIYGSFSSSTTSSSFLGSSSVSGSSSSSSSSSGLISLASTTVGNLANTVQNGTISISLPGCSTTLFGESSCQLDRDSVGTFYTSIDLAISLFILLAFVWLAYFERKEEKEQMKKTYYASMFTVLVRNLPSSFEEKELKLYFESLLGTILSSCVIVQRFFILLCLQREGAKFIVLQ
jgi:hypothetical protein